MYQYNIYNICINTILKINNKMYQYSMFTKHDKFYTAISCCVFRYFDSCVHDDQSIITTNLELAV